MMTSSHKHTYYICDPIYILTYTPTAHAVHTASPTGIPRVLCAYRFCYRGKVFKYLWSCGKNPTALGCAGVDLMDRPFPLKGQADNNLCESIPSLPACPLNQSFEPADTGTPITTTSSLQENKPIGKLCKTLNKHL